MLIKVPVTVIVGRQDKDIALCIFEGRNISISRYVDELPEPAIEKISELDIGDEEIRGHVAVTSFGHSTVKAVDAGSSSGTCYITRGGDLVELPRVNLRKSSIMNKDFGRWVNVLSLPIFLENIINYDDTGSIVLAPSRLGENLCITFGYSDSTCIRLVKHFILRARACDSGAMMTVSCVGRIPQIPLEMCLIREDKYILFRIYLNTLLRLHTRFKMLIVIAKGGNIVKRYIADNLSDDLTETIDEAFEIFQNL
ncbi:MAG: hypothetical protein GXO10_00375 [Crenarchaeota archaeon]|nr:hypothetical protein [Thermoproteota archaeon]